VGPHRVHCIIDRQSVGDQTYQQHVAVSADSVTLDCPDGMHTVHRTERAATLAIGVGFGVDDDIAHAALYEYRFWSRRDGQQRTLIEPVGWIAAIGADSPAMLSRFPAAVFDEVYRSGPDIVHAGSLVPRGRAEPVDGGYLFTGQWPFASGCCHADYIAVNALVVDPSGSASAPRAAVVPASKIRIVDTWHVNGLRGTGSHDVAADNLFVPHGWTTSLLDPAPVIRHPLDALPLLGRLGVELAACAVGIAQAAVDEATRVCHDKRPLGGLLGRLAGDPVMQYQLGEAELNVRTARILLQHTTHLDHIIAERPEPPTPRELLERRTLLSRIVELCATAVDQAYKMCGTTGLFTNSPLQRQQRDIRVLTQHFLFSFNSLTPSGANLLGESTQAAMF